MSRKWDQHFMKVAEDWADCSKNPSTKVGAVLVRDRQVISSGYNGFPRGVRDLEERLNNRPVKYQLIVHAELNTIINAAREGVCTKDSTLYVTAFHPCHECAKAIIQAGIVRVVITDGRNDRWESSCQVASEMFNEVGILVDQIDYRGVIMRTIDPAVFKGLLS